MYYFVLIIVGVICLAVVTIALLFLMLFVGEILLDRLQFGRAGRFLLVSLKSLRRNILRTTLTYLATFVLVIVAVMNWSVLHFLDVLTTEKAKDLKIIVTEKYQVGGRMPFYYGDLLSEGGADPKRKTDIKPQDSMTWQIYTGTLDAERKNPENLVIFIAMEPRKMLTIMESLFDDIRPGDTEYHGPTRAEQTRMLQDVVQKMEKNKRAVIVGEERLAAIKKGIGERFSLTGINYPGLDLEFEIVGVFPKGRYDQTAVMSRDYFNDALDAYPITHSGVKHPLAARTLDIVWLQVADQHAFTQLAEQLERSGKFDNPAIKCETLSSGINTWIEGFQDLFWAMRYMVSPAILVTMVLVIANAISISVRERRAEIAVLKVLGYRPNQILAIVLVEAVLIGAFSGFISALMTYLVVNNAPHSQSFQIWVPHSALWWGPSLGALAALAGSILPGWNACKVRVSEVFARTT